MLSVGKREGQCWYGSARLTPAPRSRHADEGGDSSVSRTSSFPGSKRQRVRAGPCLVTGGSYSQGGGSEGSCGHSSGFWKKVVRGNSAAADVHDRKWTCFHGIKDRRGRSCGELGVNAPLRNTMLKHHAMYVCHTSL